MNHTIRRFAACLFSSIVASFLLASQAAAVHHVREYVVPFVPGAARTAYRNTVITVTNHQGDPAPISINAYVNRSRTAQSCGNITDLAPNEIRRFARNAGTLCVANDESADSYLRIRTVEGVHVEGFQVLAANRGNAFVPINVVSTEPAGPDGISIRTLTLQGTQTGRWRLSVGLRNSSGIWPNQLVACVHARSINFRENSLFNSPANNCALPNEQILGWTAYLNTRTNILNFRTQDGTHTSEIASVDIELHTAVHQSNPATVRAVGVILLIHANDPTFLVGGYHTANVTPSTQTDSTTAIFEEFAGGRFSANIRDGEGGTIWPKPSDGLCTEGPQFTGELYGFSYDADFGGGETPWIVDMCRPDTTKIPQRLNINGTPLTFVRRGRGTGGNEINRNHWGFTGFPAPVPGTKYQIQLTYTNGDVQLWGDERKQADSESSRTVVL